MCKGDNEGRSPKGWGEWTSMKRSGWQAWSDNIDELKDRFSFCAKNPDELNDALADLDKKDFHRLVLIVDVLNSHVEENIRVQIELGMVPGLSEEDLDNPLPEDEE